MPCGPEYIWGIAMPSFGVIFWEERIVFCVLLPVGVTTRIIFVVRDRY